MASFAGHGRIGGDPSRVVARVGIAIVSSAGEEAPRTNADDNLARPAKRHGAKPLLVPQYDVLVINDSSGRGIEELRAWIRGICKESEARGGALPLGFDLEWRPSFQKGRENKVALLQLSTTTNALLVQMFQTVGSRDAETRSAYAAALDFVLTSPSFFKVGVGILDDCKKLLDDWSLDVKYRVEVNEVCSRCFASMKFNSAPSFHSGLKNLAKSVLNLEISKPKKVTMSNWERYPLTVAQIKYASQDAWLGAALLEVLCDMGSTTHGDEFVAAMHSCVHGEPIADEIAARELAKAERRREKRRQKRIEKQKKKKLQGANGNDTQKQPANRRRRKSKNKNQN